MKSNHSAVGYRNPPEHTRFRPGQSGNPKGRPKGTLNLATVLERTLRETVVITVKGKRKTVTKLEAAVTQLSDKAVGGDMKAFQQLSTLVRSAEEREVQAPVANSDLDEVDEQIVLEIVERFENSRKKNPVKGAQRNEDKGDTKSE
jgi:hypothetical protein